MDIYLKTGSREELDQLIHLLDSDVLIDIIGTIVINGPDYNPQTGEGTVIAKSGYHTNLRFLEDPPQEVLDALAPYTITTPETPYRVWA